MDTLQVRVGERKEEERRVGGRDRERPCVCEAAVAVAAAPHLQLPRPCARYCITDATGSSARVLWQASLASAGSEALNAPLLCRRTGRPAY